MDNYVIAEQAAPIESPRISTPLPEVIAVEAISQPPQLKTDRPPQPKRTVPKWETTARDRVKAALKRFNKPLFDLVERDANEGDTRLLVADFLCEGLGFDKYEDLTTEYQVKGEFADYGLRIEKQLIAFIEVKRCTQKLGSRHLRQAQSASDPSPNGPMSRRDRQTPR